MCIPAMNLTFSCCCYLGFLGVLTSHQVLSLMALRRVTHLTNLTLSVIRLSLQRKFAWIISEVKACCTILYIFTQWSSCMYNWHINTTDSMCNIDIWAIMLFSNPQWCTCIQCCITQFAAQMLGVLLRSNWSQLIYAVPFTSLFKIDRICW